MEILKSLLVSSSTYVEDNLILLVVDHMFAVVDMLAPAQELVVAGDT